MLKLPLRAGFESQVIEKEKLIQVNRAEFTLINRPVYR